MLVLFQHLPIIDSHGEGGVPFGYQSVFPARDKANLVPWWGRQPQNLLIAVEHQTYANRFIWPRENAKGKQRYALNLLDQNMPNFDSRMLVQGDARTDHQDFVRMMTIQA